MSWLMVESDSEVLRQKLRKAKISFRARGVGKPFFPGWGLTFPRECLEEVAAIMKIPLWELGRFVEWETDIQDIALIRFPFVSRPDSLVARAETRVRDPEGWHSIRPALHQFAREHSLKIVVFDDRGNPKQQVKSKGMFLVYLFSAPVRTEKRRMPRKIFGQNLLNAGEESFSPSGEGIIIRDGEGTQVAELLKNRLYILFDIGNSGYPGKLLKMILSEVEKHPLAVAEDEGDSLFDGGSEGDESERYVQSCLSGFLWLKSELSRAEAERKSVQEKISQGEKEIISLKRKREELLRKIVRFGSSKEDARERLGAEFNNLFRIKELKDVKVFSDRIEVYTDEIKILYEGKTYRIGRFKIVIRPKDRSSGVRCFNLTRKMEDYHHPHIRSYGECCFGNVEKEIDKLIRTGQYLPAISLILSFLRSYNQGSAYIKIYDF